MTAGGDNTARTDLPCYCWQGVRSHTYAADCPQHGHLAVPAADRQTDEDGMTETAAVQWGAAYVAALEAGTVDPYCPDHGHLSTAYTSCSCPDRQTDEERTGWADDCKQVCGSVAGCFPEPCRIDHPAARPAHADAVMADLGAAITEGVTEARLRALVDDWAERSEHLAAKAANAPTRAEGSYVTFWIGMADGYLRAAAELRAALGGEGA